MVKLTGEAKRGISEIHPPLVAAASKTGKLLTASVILVTLQVSLFVGCTGPSPSLTEPTVHTSASNLMPSVEDLGKNWRKTAGWEAKTEEQRSSYVAYFRWDVLDVTIVLQYAITVFPSIETAREFWDARKAKAKDIASGNPEIGEESYREGRDATEYPALVFRRANVIALMWPIQAYGTAEAYDSFAKIVDEKIRKALR